ncbi:MAG: HAMP domain-containing histidine kinase [Chitinophagaceae bacterium]|nr:HAMP domain-containing histidine kinase [Chitinophagaceae bacterium]
MKLASKINILFTVIVSSILLGMGIIIYSVSRQRVEKEFRQRLQSRARSAAKLYQVFKEDSINLLRSLDASSPASLYNKNISIYNDNNAPLYIYHDKNTDDLSPDSIRLRLAKEKGENFYHAGNKEVLLYYFSQENSFTVLVAAENIIGREYLQNLKNIFFIYFPVALAVTLIAGYLFSKRLVRPVKQTIQDVNLITSQNLSHRLYIGSNKDELTELNRTFNDLLNRLEESFNIQKRFIANASHELSTPLTSISSQIEVAMLQERNTDEYRKVLSSVLEDVKDLHQLTKNLLEIAKAGTHGAIQLDKIRMDEVLLRSHSEVIKQNPGSRVELDFPELPEDENECMVFGNPHLLHIAFKNIMENGCKYSPDKMVRVKLVFKGKRAELIFFNKSDAIPDEEIEHIFEPFYRSSNAMTEPGFGLGLTLTRRIIRLHKGAIDIQSGTDNGTTVTIVLPTLKK